ncbi:KR domain-containing protein [Paenibacillus glucanolyticus]
MNRSKISLPTYPFEKTRHWFDHTDEDIYHRMNWVRQDLEKPYVIQSSATTLLFCGKNKNSELIESKIMDERSDVIQVSLGNRYSKISDNRFILDGSESSYFTMFNDIRNRQIQEIIHLHSLVQGAEDLDSLESLQEFNDSGIHSLFHIVRSFMKSNHTGKISLIVVTENANLVSKEQTSIQPHGGALYGLGKVINTEHPQLQCRIIDIDGVANVDAIWVEINQVSSDYAVAYRNQVRYVEKLQTSRMDEIENQPTRIKKDGVYVITGGIGGIGLETANYLSTQNKVNLILINRTSFPEPSEWDHILHLNQNDKLCYNIRKLNTITASGSQVKLYCGDVCDTQRMNEILSEVRNTFGRIDGIIHGAGVPGTDDFVVNKDFVSFKKETEAKIHGCWTIDKLTEKDQLDFFVMQSSIASIIGDAGQSAYSAANRFMDAYAAYRNRNGKRTLSINWPIWYKVGMALEHNSSRYEGIFKPIDPKEAIRIFSVLLNKNISNVVIGRVDPSRLEEGRIVEAKRPKRLRGEAVEPYRPYAEDAIPECTNTEATLWRIWSEVLETDQIRLDDDFVELGGNSILSLNIEVKMQNLGMQIEEADLKRYNTIRKLAAYLDRQDVGPCDDQPQERGLAGNHKPSLNRWKPFNTVFYKYCFYNSLFPVITRMGASIHPFLANDVVLYSFDKQASFTETFVSFRSLYTLKQLMDQMGIPIHAKSHCTRRKAEFDVADADIVMLNNYYKDIGMVSESCREVANLKSDLEDSMLLKRPVILWIDCYYDSSRKDTYLKLHWPHALLVLENDSIRQRFMVMDHDNRDSLNYKIRHITHKDVYRSYEGFLSNYKIHTSLPTYFEIYTENAERKHQEFDLNTIAISYAKNVLRAREDLIVGLANLESFCFRMEEMISSEESLNIHAEDLVDNLNGITDGKKIDKFRSHELWGPHSDLFKEADALLFKWVQMKSIIAKYLFSHKYEFKKMNEVKKLLQEIRMMEKTYHDTQIGYMESITIN